MQASTGLFLETPSLSEHLQLLIHRVKSNKVGVGGWGGGGERQKESPCLYRRGNSFCKGNVIGTKTRYAPCFLPSEVHPYSFVVVVWPNILKALSTDYLKTFLSQRLEILGISSWVSEHTSSRFSANTLHNSRCNFLQVAKQKVYSCNKNKIVMLVLK